MITPKQRAYLKSLAHNLNPLMQIGKNGLTEGTIKQIDELLEAHELVKISCLKNSPVEPRDIAEEIMEQTGAEFVQSIGHKLTLYRESKENKKIEI